MTALRAPLLLAAIALSTAPVLASALAHTPATIRVNEVLGTLYAPGPLSSAHSRLGCEACHAPLRAPGDIPCATCHSSVGRFAPLGGASLAAHTIASEALLDAASGPGCIGCHPQHRSPRASVRALSTFHDADGFPGPSECVSCHGADHAAHPLMTRTDCDACHEQSSWTATFEHPVVDAGDGAQAEKLSSCTECHGPGWHTERWSTSRSSQKVVRCDACHAQHASR